MHAAMRPAGDTTAEAHRWTIEADDYDMAYDEATSTVPEGWVLLHLQVDQVDQANR